MEGHIYRFASVGLDAKLCVWAFDDTADTVTARGREGPIVSRWCAPLGNLLEPISLDQVGNEPLSSVVCCGEHLVSCCGAGTMHLWRHFEPQPQAEEEDDEPAAC